MTDEFDGRDDSSKRLKDLNWTIPFSVLAHAVDLLICSFFSSVVFLWRIYCIGYIQGLTCVCVYTHTHIHIHTHTHRSMVILGSVGAQELCKNPGDRP